MSPRFLTALPVYNEAEHVDGVLEEVLRYSDDVLVVDDGSTDGTADLLAHRDDIAVLTHRKNRGYGAALRSAFDYAIRRRYEVLVTIDCDGQHEPQRIREFVAACRTSEPDCLPGRATRGVGRPLQAVERPTSRVQDGLERPSYSRPEARAGVDIVSGSRYLHQFPGDRSAPEDRRRINEIVTAELNERLGLALTDAFCGQKAYRVASLRRMQLAEDGYAMPLELWVEAAVLGLRVVELPVPRIYLDESRSFGGALDQAETRLAYYRRVVERSLAIRMAAPAGQFSTSLCSERCG